MTSAATSTSGQRDSGRLRLSDVPLILMYHGVERVAKDPYDLCVTPERFSEQMTWLAEHGLRGVSIDTLVAAMRPGRAQGLVGITFDDGYLSVLENAVPELLRHGFTATMFIVSDLLGRTNKWDGDPAWPLMTAQHLVEVAAAGMEIGSHTATHPELPGLDAHLLRAELGESKAKLSEILGSPVRGFAYPYGVMDDSVRHAVEDAGYDYACSIVTPIADLGIMALPRIVFNQRDGSVRMAAKKTFIEGYTAIRATRRSISHNLFPRGVKRSLLGQRAMPHP